MLQIVSYQELLNNKQNLNSIIQNAFGENGLGILAVSGVPNLEKKRIKLLKCSVEFSKLKEEVKNEYVLEDAYYSFGWSHGKEKLQGKMDTAKGSYYNNPMYNQPVKDETLMKKYPSFLHPNIWPTKHVPDMEHAFMDLGQLMVEMGTLVAKHCDRYTQSKCPSYSENRLTDIVQHSLCCKGRLLHYFPKENEPTALEEDQDEFSTWCGWHNDHGSLTALVQAMYFDQDGNPVENTDKNAGLYVKTRNGQVQKVIIPPHHLIFQIGEAAQIHSGGILQATPHAVKGSALPNISRDTFAVFMEPNWDEKMNVPELTNSKLASDTSYLPKGVPSLSSRWNNTMDFATFAESTLNAYH